MYADIDYSQVLLKGLNDLRKRGSLCDVELHVTDMVFCAHKVVLSACSKYFKAMFTGKMEESSKYKVQLHQVHPESLKDIINFAYTGNVSITLRNVQDLLATARMLQLERIVDACCEFMMSHIHPSNCIGILTFAELHSCDQLWAHAFEYLEDQFMQIISFEEFLKIDVSLIKKVLQSDNLNVATEEDVLNAVEAWVLYDTEARRILIPELFLDGLRIFHLNTNFISSYVRDGTLSLLSHQCKKIFTDVLALKLDPRRITDNRLESTPPCRREANQIMVIGGKTGLFDILTCCEWHNELGDWDVISATNSKRSGASAAVLNGNVYLVGGIVEHNSPVTSSVIQTCDGRVEMFDPLLFKWSYAPSLKEPRYNHETVTLDSVLYVFGGYSGQNCLKSVECYSEYTRQWKSVRPMQYSRSCFAAVALDGCIYVLGGYGNVHLSCVERYDPKRDKWSLVPAMSTARNNFGACALHGFIYAVGGHDGVTYLRSIERYDPSTTEWSLVTMLESPRSGLGVCVMNEKIYVMGGHSGSKYLRSVRTYDPKKDTWTDAPSMTIARCYMAAVSLWSR